MRPAAEAAKSWLVFLDLERGCALRGHGSLHGGARLRTWMLRSGVSHHDAVDLQADVLAHSRRPMSGKPAGDDLRPAVQGEAHHRVATVKLDPDDARSRRVRGRGR